MRKTLIACRTIERELRTAMAACGFEGELVLIESGLHNAPARLHARLQQALDDCEDCDAALLALGACGNAVSGLRAGDFQLILPRAEDCISLLLGGQNAQRPIDTYFLTQGWLEGERNIWCEYEHCIKRYGAACGREIFDQMFHNYRSITLLDTGCYDTESARVEARRIADVLGLELRLQRGTLRLLQELITGPWTPDRFILTPPGEKLQTGIPG